MQIRLSILIYSEKVSFTFLFLEIYVTLLFVFLVVLSELSLPVTCGPGELSLLLSSARFELFYF